MKVYKNGAIVKIPFVGMDAAGEKTYEWGVVTFAAGVRHRRIKRTVRQWVKFYLGRHIAKDEHEQIMRHRVEAL